jgi:ribosome-associated protein
MRKMPDDVIISDQITIPSAEIVLSAVRSQGAGGQNVNKVASAIHLRFDVAGSSALPEAVRDRLLARNDQRITEDGVLIIKSQEYRTRERNRRAALDRRAEIVQSALVEPRSRKKTKPSKRSQEQRLAAKRHRSEIKKQRGRQSPED